MCDWEHSDFPIDTWGEVITAEYITVFKGVLDSCSGTPTRKEATATSGTSFPQIIAASKLSTSTIPQQVDRGSAQRENWVWQLRRSVFWPPNENCLKLRRTENQTEEWHITRFPTSAFPAYWRTSISWCHYHWCAVVCNSVKRIPARAPRHGGHRSTALRPAPTWVKSWKPCRSGMASYLEWQTGWYVICDIWYINNPWGGNPQPDKDLSRPDRWPQGGLPYESWTMFLWSNAWDCTWWARLYFQTLLHDWGTCSKTNS